MKFNIPASNLPRVVIIGGGFAGLSLARRLKGAELQVVLVDKSNFHTFQPLLYQVATAGLEPDSIAYPLRKILHRQKNLIFRMAEVCRVFPESCEIETSIGRFSYDYLVIATGSRTNYFGIDGLEEKVYPLKSIQDAFELRNFILLQFERALLTTDLDEREALMTFVIVGGGPTGVETAGALSELKHHILPTDYPELDLRRMQVHVLEAANRLLPAMSPEASAKSLEFLKEMDVKVWLDSPVRDYDGEYVHLAGSKKIRSDTVIWTAGVSGAPIAGLPEASLYRGNRLLVDDLSRVQGCPNIFAIGDIAAMVTADNKEAHPMLAPVAIQQGRHLARNLRLLNEGKKPVPFVYRDKGTMATVGRNRAVVDLGRLRFQGLFAWFLWMYLHLLFLVGFRNKLVVFVNWVWNYFTYDRGIRLILRGFRSARGEKAMVEQSSSTSEMADTSTEDKGERTRQAR